MASVDLHYDEQGDPANPPLIIVHGFFASARNWRYIATQLAQRYHVFTLDMRNHGASPHAEPMDYPTMAEDLKAFVVNQGLTSVALLGHSMGGKVAMWFALQYPALVQKLVIVDIAPVSYTHSFDLMINALMAMPLSDLSNRKQADEWLGHAIAATNFRQFLLQNLILKEGQYQWRIDLAIFKRAAPYIVAFPVSDQVSPYTGSVLVLAGERSNFAQADTFQALFPFAVFQTIAHAGHWLHVDAPQAFLNAVQGYLDGGSF
ncbi:MAG: alpha/beta fold hydrolase [Methylococcales bacterium]